MVNRVVAAVTTIFVVAVIALFVRHHRAKAKNDERLTALVAAARADDARRIDAIREAMSVEPSQRPCPMTTRAKVVRLERVDAPGARLHDINAAVVEEREPPVLDRELDVIEGRAFLYDYPARRVICVGRDAEDPHGTLVGY